MRQAQRPARPREVLGEVPALHPLHAGQGVQGGAQLLLHLQTHSPPRGSMPEAEGDGGWQRHSGTACPCPYPEREDPGRRRSRACAEERGAELGDEGQQPLHLHQPPPAPPGAAGAVSRSPLPGRTEAVAAGDRAGMLGTPTVLVCAPGRPSLRRSGRGEDLSVLRGRRARSRAEQRSPRAAPAPPASAGRMLSAAGDGVRARGWRGCVPRTGGGQGAGTPAPGAELAPAWPLALSLLWARSVTCPAGRDAVLALCSAGCHRRWLRQRPGATVLWALGAWTRSRCLAAPHPSSHCIWGGPFPHSPPLPPPLPGAGGAPPAAPSAVLCLPPFVQLSNTKFLYDCLE